MIKAALLSVIVFMLFAGACNRAWYDSAYYWRDWHRYAHRDFARVRDDARYEAQRAREEARRVREEARREAQRAREDARREARRAREHMREAAEEFRREMRRARDDWF